MLTTTHQSVRLAWGLLTVLVVLLLAVRFGEWFTHPTGWVIEPYGDGFKSYQVPEYHIKYDSTYSFYEGMQYPYREHIVAADGQPSLSIPLKWLFRQGLDLSDYFPGFLHASLLLSLLGGILYLFALFRKLDVDPYFAVFAALGIALLSPQMVRMETHYGLAHIVVIPAVMYYLLRYVQRPRLRQAIPLLVLTVFFSGLHFYYFALLFLTISFFLFCYGLFSWRVSLWVKMSVHYLVIAIIPLAGFLYWLNSGDLPTDRCPQPWGFFSFYGMPEGLVFSPWQPHWQLLEAKGVALRLTALENIERTAYLGMVTILGLVVGGGQWLFRRSWRTLPRPFPVRLRWIMAMALASVVVVLISWGLPFTLPGFDQLLNYTGPFRQFRSVGRFGWLLYYVANVLFFAGLYHRMKTVSWRWVVWVPAFLLLAWEIYHYQQRINIGLDPVPVMQPGQRFTEIGGIRYPDYQAVVTAPYYNLGSDQVWLEPEGFILQQSLVLGVQTGLPTTSAMLTRTSRSQTWRELQLVTEPYRYPELLNELTDQRPFLLMVDKVMLERSTIRYQHLLEGAEPLYDTDRLALFRLPLNTFATRLEKTRQRIRETIDSSAWEQQAGFFVSPGTTSWIWESWDTHQETALRYQGTGAVKAGLWPGDVIFQGAFSGNPTPGPQVLSIWVNIQEDRRSTARLTLDELAPDGTLRQRQDIPIQAYLRVFDPSGWALLEYSWALTAADSQVRLRVQHSDLRKEALFLDELWIRPAESNVALRKDNLYMYNNRFFDISE